MLRTLAAFAVLAAALAGCGSATHAEASYKVWENGCKTLQTFTQAEVVSTWGSGALSGEQLRGTPAAINSECEAQHRRERKTP